MKTTSLKQIVSVFIFFIFLLSVWSIVGAVGFFDAVVSKGWPTTTGTVVSSQVLSPSGKANKYIAEITYTYSVDWKEYRSKNYKATAARGTSTWARELVEQHPVNSTVTVHYNPKDPGDALVEPGLQSDNYIMTFVPLMFIAVLIIALRKQINDRKEQDMKEPQ